MGSSSLPTLIITQNKFNKIKWNHKSQGRQWELKQIHFLVRDKVIKSNSQCKDDQYIYHMMKYQLSKDKRYFELLISRWYFTHKSKIIFTTKKHMKRIRIKHHAKEDIFDRLKLLNNHAKQ
jgi:hypothetical protein